MLTSTLNLTPYRNMSLWSKHKTKQDDLWMYYNTFSYSSHSSFSRVGPVNPTWLGAGHTEEFQFVFGWSFDENILQYKHELTDDEKTLSAQMMKMWTNFAKSGWELGNKWDMFCFFEFNTCTIVDCLFIPIQWLIVSHQYPIYIHIYNNSPPPPLL